MRLSSVVGLVWLVLAPGVALAQEGAPPVSQTTAATPEDDDPPIRLSLPTEEDIVSWQRPGFRMQLGYGQSRLSGRGPAYSLMTHTIVVRPEVRLDEYWSLAATFNYGISTGGFEGLRWSATLEPVLWVTRGFSVAVGLGYGGIIGNDPNSFEDDFGGSRFSRDRSQDEESSSCDGSGLVGTGKAHYMFVVGPLFSTGPYGQLEAQWTDCRQSSFGRINLETGREIHDSQSWTHLGFTVGWLLAWR